MKWNNQLRYAAGILSHPVRGAWIEILEIICGQGSDFESHPVRGAWIEILKLFVFLALDMSHPVRGAWIEIGRDDDQS